MKSLLRKLKTAWRLPLRRKVWALVMYPLSGLIRASVLSIPFKYLNKGLGIQHKNYQLCPLVTDYQLQRSVEIGRTIRMIAKYTPWKTNCMVEAILARIFLAYYDIPYIFYMGAYLTKDPKEPMKAHAWLSTGPYIIVGGRGHKKYAIVSSFVSKHFQEPLCSQS